MGDVFRAGVKPGGLTADYEIKILICYVLYHVQRPIPVSMMMELLTAEGIANYFESANAAAGLVQSGHITIEKQQGEACYRNTELGESTAVSFERNLPRSIREKAVEAAKEGFARKDQRAHHETSVKKVEDGYLLTLTLHDIGSDLLSITLLLPDRENCRKVQERFWENPMVIYKGVIALLTGSYESLGALLDEPDEV